MECYRSNESDMPGNTVTPRGEQMVVCRSDLGAPTQALEGIGGVWHVRGRRGADQALSSALEPTRLDRAEPADPRDDPRPNQ